jgi:hypothetical protein
MWGEPVIYTSFDQDSLDDLGIYYDHVITNNFLNHLNYPDQMTYILQVLPTCWRQDVLRQILIDINRFFTYTNNSFNI